MFLGVLDDATVEGVPPKAASDMVKNFISIISNPNIFSPTIYLVPEILDFEGKTVIHVHIPPSAEVHSYRKDVYDRVESADIRVTATAQIAQMYIRKQNIFTEKKIYPYVQLEDLRLDLLPKLRIMAVNNSENQNHPWSTMSDEELLKSAGLYGRDRVTGEQGYNLAAVMLLGKDDVIMDVAPAYVTDALVRRVNTDRYDDREVIKTNLIESYERLIEFGRKHLLDKFFLEEDQRKSLRTIIIREMIANVLVHREFTSSYQAKFVIEKERMYVENANRATQEALIDTLNPILRGWANYNRHVCSKEVFCKIDHIIVNQLMRWGYRRHPRKKRHWTNRRYFISDGRNRWTFGFKYTEDGKEKTYSLLRLADIPIARYVKVKAEANPFDPAWDEYFAKRAKRSNRQRKAKGARDAQAA